MMNETKGAADKPSCARASESSTLILYTHAGSHDPTQGPLAKDTSTHVARQEPFYDQTALKRVSTPQGPTPITSRHFGGDEAEAWALKFDLRP
jgi:hypothetical protein